jgi:hypothetical protein
MVAQLYVQRATRGQAQSSSWPPSEPSSQACTKSLYGYYGITDNILECFLHLFVGPVAALSKGREASKNTNKLKMHGLSTDCVSPSMIAYTCCQVRAVCTHMSILIRQRSDMRFRLLTIGALATHWASSTMSFLMRY